MSAGGVSTGISPTRGGDRCLTRSVREHPGVRLDWRAVGFPVAGRSLLDGADVGVLVHPPPEVGVRALTLETSPMVVVMAVGHRLAQQGTLSVADVLDEPFPGALSLRPEWSAFWTLDKQRGRPPKRTNNITCAEQGLQVVVAGRAIATVPDWIRQRSRPPRRDRACHSRTDRRSAPAWSGATRRSTHSCLAWSNSPQRGPMIVTMDAAPDIV